MLYEVITPSHAGEHRCHLAGQFGRDDAAAAVGQFAAVEGNAEMGAAGATGKAGVFRTVRHVDEDTVVVLNRITSYNVCYTKLLRA